MWGGAQKRFWQKCFWGVTFRLNWVEFFYFLYTIFCKPFYLCSVAAYEAGNLYQFWFVAHSGATNKYQTLSLDEHRLKLQDTLKLFCDCLGGWFVKENPDIFQYGRMEMWCGTPNIYQEGFREKELNWCPLSRLAPRPIISPIGFLFQQTKQLL